VLWAGAESLTDRFDFGAPLGRAGPVCPPSATHTAPSAPQFSCRIFSPGNATASICSKLCLRCNYTPCARSVIVTFVVCLVTGFVEKGSIFKILLFFHKTPKSSSSQLYKKSLHLNSTHTTFCKNNNLKLVFRTHLAIISIFSLKEPLKHNILCVLVLTHKCCS